MNESKGRLISIEELMKQLDIGKTTAYQLLSSGELRALKIGRVWKIPEDAVDHYVSEKIMKSERSDSNVW